VVCDVDMLFGTGRCRLCVGEMNRGKVTRPFTDRLPSERRMTPSDCHLRKIVGLLKYQITAY
jgi:hypothetical protein